MPGINLSQSLQEKQKAAHGSFFDRGFFVAAVLFSITLIIYTGVWLYGNMLGKQIVEADALLQAKQNELKGETVDRIADLRLRLDTVKTNNENEPHPDLAFADLEKHVLPEIRLTEYSYNVENKMLTITGVTNNLKYVAQEMLLLKKLETVEKVVVETIEYKKDGIILFELVLSVAAPSNS